MDALRYDVEIPGPDRTITLNGLGPESVAHLKLHPDPSRPWRGRSWLDVAGPDGVALARLVLRFGEETAGPTGKVLARVAGASGGAVDWYANTSKMLSKMRGGASVLGDNMQGNTPPALLRLGVDVPGPVLQLYEKLGAAVAQSLGFPPQLVGITATGATARRDTLATWVRGVVCRLGLHLVGRVRPSPGNAVSVEHGRILASGQSARTHPGCCHFAGGGVVCGRCRTAGGSEMTGRRTA